MAGFKIALRISVVLSTVLYTTSGAPSTDTETLSLNSESDDFSHATEEPSPLKLSTAPRSTPFPTEAPVTVLERFYRVYEDGTNEWKIALSNGVAQYQKITNKLYQGRTIQVYEGYNSERLPDNTYRTSHYIADENGYQLLKREFDTIPPALPPYVPHKPKV